MRIGRVIITPAILLLAAAGSIAAASAMPAVAAAPAGHVHIIASAAATQGPNILYHT